VLTDAVNDTAALMSDLRRAATPGAVGDAGDRRAGILVDSGARSGADRFVPSAAPLAIAIDGPGMFVLRDHDRTVYSRLGDFKLDETGRLVDELGRAVMGFESRLGAGAAPVGVNPRDFSAQRFATYRIDERGLLVGVEHRTEHRSPKKHEVLVPIAQLAIAIFPVPERLEREGDSSFLATRAAGTPALDVAGVGGRGSIRQHVLASGSIDIEGDLRRLWMLRRKEEIDTALASASDACVRTALGLVR